MTVDNFVDYSPALMAPMWLCRGVSSGPGGWVQLTPGVHPLCFT